MPTGSPGSRATAAPGSTLASGPALVLDGVDVAYGGAVQALSGVSLTVDPGQVIALLGGNGAGKSTLLNAVSGVLPMLGGAVVGGSLRFGEVDLARAQPSEIVRAGVVQVPEGRRIFAQLTVQENLKVGGLGVRDKAQLEEAYAQVLSLFPVLADRGHQRAGLMSGGEQQMLAIGRALMSSPRLLMLDEPSLGLAPKIVEQIGEVVTRIRDLGTSVLIVEQNAQMALSVADAAVVLENGEVAVAGPAAELRESDEVSSRYLGDSGRVTIGTQARPATEEAGAADERPLLSVRDLTVRFGGVVALDSVTFDVAPRSVHAVIGPNGAGKSTLFNALTGLVPLSGGQVTYRGERVDELPPHQLVRRGMARTFQNIVLMPDQSVLENLLVGSFHTGRAGVLATSLGLPRARREEREQRERVHQVVELLDLTADLHRCVDVLPYGVRKRVEMGRALCADPTLLMLDEPAAGMNADETRRLAQSVVDIRAELGVTVLLVEHDMGFVMGIADAVTVLDFGHLLTTGTPAEVRRNSQVIAAYLGVGAEEAAETGTGRSDA